MQLPISFAVQLREAVRAQNFLTLLAVYGPSRLAALTTQWVDNDLRYGVITTIAV